MFTTEEKQNTGLAYFSAYRPSMAGLNAGNDFKTLLGNQFLELFRIMLDVADEEVTQISVPGFQPMDKSNPAYQIVVAYETSLMENQIGFEMGQAELIYKTVPQKLDALFG